MRYCSHNGGSICTNQPPLFSQEVHSVDSKVAKVSSTVCGILANNLSPLKSPLSQNQSLQKSNHHLRSDWNDNCRTSISSHLMSISQPFHPAYSTASRSTRTSSLMNPISVTQVCSIPRRLQEDRSAHNLQQH